VTGIEMGGMWWKVMDGKDSQPKVVANFWISCCGCMVVFGWLRIRIDMENEG
jgi:hypothetical protein